MRQLEHRGAEVGGVSRLHLITLFLPQLELHVLDRRLDALVVNQASYGSRTPHSIAARLRPAMHVRSCVRRSSSQRTLIFQYFRLSLANTFSAVAGSLFGLAIASLTLLTRCQNRDQPGHYCRSCLHAICLCLQAPHVS